MLIRGFQRAILFRFGKLGYLWHVVFLRKSSVVPVGELVVSRLLGSLGKPVVSTLSGCISFHCYLLGVNLLDFNS
jgi:hypothetical protein